MGQSVKKTEGPGERMKRRNRTSTRRKLLILVAHGARDYP